MRTSEQRSDKMGQKLVGEDIKKKIDAHRKDQIKNYNLSVGELVALEHQIKMIIGDKILAAHRPYYLIFGKELYRRKRLYSGQMFYNEMVLLENKWIGRGLDFDVLDNIKRLFWPSYPELEWFKCDISLLDGEDRLA